MLMPDDFRSFSKIKIDNHSFNKENLPSHFKVVFFRRMHPPVKIIDGTVAVFNSECTKRQRVHICLQVSVFFASPLNFLNIFFVISFNRNLLF